MQITLVSIGDELLKGAVLNTNVQVLASLLYQHGYFLNQETTLPDDKAILLKSLQNIWEQSDVMVLCGGLGPTHDDITREVVAEMLGCKLELNQSVYDDLKRRFGERKISAENQAMTLTGATILGQSLGTAPAQLLKIEHKSMVLLPGVPLEFQHICQSALIPMLIAEYPCHTQRLTAQLRFFTLGEASIKDHLNQLVKKFPKVMIGVYPNLSLIDIHLQANVLLRDDFEFVKEELLRKYADHYYGDQDADLAQLVHFGLDRAGLNLHVIEHFTAGVLTAKLSADLSTSDTNHMRSEVVTHLSGAAFHDYCEAILSREHAADQVTVIVGEVDDNNEVLLQVYKGLKKCSEENCFLSLDVQAGRTRTAHVAMGRIYQNLS